MLKIIQSSEETWNGIIKLSSSGFNQYVAVVLEKFVIVSVVKLNGIHYSNIDCLCLQKSRS